MQTPPTTPAPTIASKKRNPALLYGAVGAAVLIIALAIWAFAKGSSGPPRLNENTVVLSKFVSSKDYDKLPFDQQRQYMKVLDDREKEIDSAFESKTITESEYRSALEAAWLGKHIARVENYHALPPGQPRLEYLKKLVDKKLDKDQKKSDKKSGSPKDNSSKPEKIEADETAAELRVESWPSDIRTKWNIFHNAYRDEKKAREEALKPKEASNTSQ